MTNILGIGKNGGERKRDELIEMQRENDLAMKQEGWLRQFDVIVKVLTVDKECKKCMGKGYLGVLFAPSRMIGNGKRTEARYELLTCVCARIPERLDPLVMWKRFDIQAAKMAEIQAQLNVLYGTTLIGFFHTGWWRFTETVKFLMSGGKEQEQERETVEGRGKTEEQGAGEQKPEGI